MTDKEFIAATRRYGLRPYRSFDDKLRAEIPCDSRFYAFRHVTGSFNILYRGCAGDRFFQHYNDLGKAVASLWKYYWRFKSYPAARNFIREMEL